MTPTSIRSAHAPASIGIVHLGLGAFHRAHQAVYLERNLTRHDGGPWGIASANLRSNRRLVELMRERGQSYHVAEYTDRETLTLREVAAIRETLYAGPDGDDLDALLTRMSEPAVRIVTLTVTEKGYHLDPADGHLLSDAEPIRHDLAEPTATAECTGHAGRSAGQAARGRHAGIHGAVLRQHARQRQAHASCSASSWPRRDPPSPPGSPMPWPSPRAWSTVSSRR